MQKKNENRKYINFIIIFFSSLIILQLLTHIPIFMNALIYITTQITGFFVQLIYSDVTINEFHIISKRGIDMEIIYECTGIYGIIVYLSASLSAFWVDKFDRINGIMIGIFTIFIANIIRLVSLYIISQEYPPAFEYVHTYFWQLFLIIVIIALYYVFFLKILFSSPKNKNKLLK